MIKLELNNQIDKHKWQQLVEKSTVATFFQTVDCYEFYQKISFFKSFAFAVSENDKLVGVACGYLVGEGQGIKNYLSSRVIIPGGLLLANDISSEALNLLLNEIKNKFAKRVVYIEIRNYNDYSCFKNQIVEAGFSYEPHLNIVVPISTKEQAISNLSVTKRRQIKLSEKSGVSCVMSKNIADLKGFYEILSNLYLLKIKKPLFPFEFFEKLLNEDFTRFFVVKKNDSVLGGILTVALTDKVLYEWYVCGDDKSEVDAYPSLIATWKAIEYATENGFKFFDFMGAGKPNEDYGVREFKSRFGGRHIDTGRFLFVSKPVVYNLAKTYLKIVKKKLN